MLHSYLYTASLCFQSLQGTDAHMYIQSLLVVHAFISFINHSHTCSMQMPNCIQSKPAAMLMVPLIVVQSENPSKQL